MVARQSAVKRGEVNRDVQLELHKWRVKIRERDYPTPLYSASTILRDETVALLASVGPIDSRGALEAVLAGQWMWWTEYGEELYACLAVQTIPPMIPLPKKTRAKKRPVEGGETASVTSKRRHVDEPIITAVTSMPAASGSSVIQFATPTAPRQAPRPRTRQRAPAQTPEQIRASFRETDDPSIELFLSTLHRAQAAQQTPKNSMNQP